MIMGLGQFMGKPAPWGSDPKPYNFAASAINLEHTKSL